MCISVLPFASVIFEQNDSQSEEFNVIGQSQGENRPVRVKEAEIRWKEVALVGRRVCCA